MQIWLINILTIKLSSANDNAGNITSVKENGVQKLSYTYDSIGQLTRENNAYLGKTYVYTYDLIGNMTSKKTYAYTTAATLGTAQSTRSSTYSRDQLTSIGSTSIAYDGAGNPQTWYGVLYTVGWQGRNMTEASLGAGLDMSYSYNADGLRTKKDVDWPNLQKNIEYYYDANGRLVYETIKNAGGRNDKIIYMYDGTGRLMGLAYRDTPGATYNYFYERNGQGEIIGLFNSNGTRVVEYVYDAWGKCTIVSDTTGEKIGTLNPMRYKDYYYDIETGWYYLNSRYYDPDAGRFISPDDIEYLGADGSPNSYNRYAYCGNNPVMYADPSGHFWDTILDIGSLIWGIIDIINDPGDAGNWAALGVDLVFTVIPFIPGGAGQIIKAGNKIDNAVDVANAINKIDNINDINKVTMIGRNMNRVQNTASILGKADHLYDTWKGYDKVMRISRPLANGISMAHNGGWLLSKLRQGYTVIDIGVTTMHRGLKTYGLWYGTERFVSVVWKTRNVWKIPVNYYW